MGHSIDSTIDAVHTAGEAGAPFPGRDLFVVAQFLIPTDAQLMCGCLVAAGVPAVVADEQLVQTNLLWSPALGGVRVLAPAAFLQQAKAVMAARERGDYALDDDADVSGNAAPSELA